mgnify:CR=1 FL=1
MKYRTFEVCPRGNKTCVKTCYGEQCLECPYEKKECCEKYCIFNANSLVTRVQTGKTNVNDAIEKILK